MNEPVVYLGAFGFWLFVAVVVAIIFWAHIRKAQIRSDLIQKLIESGQPIEPDKLDKLLNPVWRHGSATAYRLDDPQAGYRNAGFVFFMVGFGTMFISFLQEPLSIMLMLLGILPMIMAYMVWSGGYKEYQAGTLPTLKYRRDPRESHQGAGGMFFFIGYGTIFIAIMRESLNLPLIILGIFAIVLAGCIWRDGERKYQAGQLTGDVIDTGDKTE